MTRYNVVFCSGTYGVDAEDANHAEAKAWDMFIEDVNVLSPGEIFGIHAEEIDERNEEENEEK